MNSIWSIDHDSIYRIDKRRYQLMYFSELFTNYMFIYFACTHLLVYYLVVFVYCDCFSSPQFHFVIYLYHTVFSHTRCTLVNISHHDLPCCAMLYVSSLCILVTLALYCYSIIIILTMKFHSDFWEIELLNGKTYFLD